MADTTPGANALTFSFPAYQLRTVMRDGEPWFVAADVCAALAMSNSRMALARLDDDEKGVSSTDTLGGAQQMAVVNESGLYSLILGSRKPEAKRFKRWVTGEVLPAIRRTGRYEAGAVATLQGQLGELAARAAAADAALASRSAELIALQRKLIGQQERELKTCRRLEAVQARMGAAQARQTMIDMERAGQPRELIQQRTGRSYAHIRVTLWKARAAGILPPLAEGDFPANMPAAERAAAAARQATLDLGGAHV